VGVTANMTTLRRKLALIAAIAFATFTANAIAKDDAIEIEYLLTAVGSSNCVFIRNGTRHSAASAESHLRLKYGKTRRHIDDADEFINKLASESSWTGKPYTLECPGEQPQPTKTWLFARLSGYRAAN
jgi:hypothetical protein